MSWYSAGGVVWEHMTPVTVDLSAYVSGTVDVVIALGGNAWQTNDQFWEAVQSDGYDVRALDANGRSLLSFDLSGWSKSSRTGTVRVDNWTPPGAGTGLIWLAYGHPSDSAADVSTTPSIATPYTGYVTLTSPADVEPSRKVAVVREAPKATVPRGRVAKTSDEVMYLWHHVEPALHRRGRWGRWAQSPRYEEPELATYDVYDGNSTVGGMVDATSPRWVLDDDTGLWLRTLVQAGTDPDNYTERVLITTTLGQTLGARMAIHVRDTEGS